MFICHGLCVVCAYIAVIEILQSEVKQIILRYNNCYRHSAKCSAVLRVSRLLHCTLLYLYLLLIMPFIADSNHSMKQSDVNED